MPLFEGTDSDFHAKLAADGANPEDTTLGLPSDFTQASRASLKLESLATIEMTLLEGLAHDTLAAIREQIKHKKAFLQQKDEEVCCQGPSTCANSFLADA